MIAKLIKLTVSGVKTPGLLFNKIYKDLERSRKILDS